MTPSEPHFENSPRPSRRELLSLWAATAAVGFAEAEPQKAVPDKADFELHELSIADLQAGLKGGRWTVRRIAEMYADRIRAVDRAGPTLRSVIEINPNWEADAKVLDAELKLGRPRGPLHGIPIMVKDNVNAAGMETTAGSLALAGSKPADAFLVARLRAVAALILGKTNLSEWANLRCTYSTSGWSGRGGQTKNPYALDRNPCGSSSGSAVAVAANLCAAAVGTETDGSIVSPASANGIVGIKPTVGLVSRAGIIPISHSQDTAGPMARTVRDAAILLGVLAGVDPDDAATGMKDHSAVADYTASFDLQGLKGARIGVARNYFGFHDGVEAVMKAALEALKAAGAILVDPADVPNADKVGEAETTVLLYELKAGLNAYLAKLGPKVPIKTLKELIAFNVKNADREMPYFGQDQLEKAEAKGDLNAYEYQEALAKCRRMMRTEGIDAVMDKNNLNALVAPTLGPACMTDWINGDRWLGGSSTAAAVAGYPSVSVPAGSVFGLPVGLLFFGRAWSEPVLLKLAYSFEQATKHRKPPLFLASVP